MTTDDILAYMAETPPKQRPTALRPAKAMLSAWLLLRDDPDFIADMLDRHNLRNHGVGLLGTPRMEHALGNAWRWASEAVEDHTSIATLANPRKSC